MSTMYVGPAAARKALAGSFQYTDYADTYSQFRNMFEIANNVPKTGVENWFKSAKHSSVSLYFDCH